jgi:HK97 family phage portal protein
VIARALGAGLGMKAETYDGGPMPSAGVRGSLSGAIDALGPGGVNLVPSKGESVWASFRLIYLTNPWVFASVNLIAASIARMPVEVFGKDPETGDPVLQRDDWPITPGRLTGGQYLDKLFDQPAGGISRQAMIRRTLVDRLVLGNGLWEILPGNGLPSGLKSVPWRGVREVIEGDDGLPLFYRVASNLSTRRITSSETRNLSAMDVVHFGRGADPDLPVGVSPLASCRNTLRLHDAVVRSLVAWFTNSMKPSAHISVDKLTREKAREIREMIVEAYASPENAGKVLVTSGKWETAQGTPDESKVVELLQTSRDEISAAYGVPQLVLGLLTGSRSAGSATTTIRSQYIRDTVGTWTADMEGDIDAQLLPVAPSWNSLDVKFNMSEQLRPDLESLSTALDSLGDAMSPDDKRAYLGLTPYRESWSEVPYTKPGSVPLDRAGDPAATGTAVATPPKQKQQPANQDEPIEDGEDGFA